MKYLFEVHAKLAVGFPDAQQYILTRFPHCEVCFDTATLEVKFFLDRWEAEDEDLFTEMQEKNLIYRWEKIQYFVVPSGRGIRVWLINQLIRSLT